MIAATLWRRTQIAKINFCNATLRARSKFSRRFVHASHREYAAVIIWQNSAQVAFTDVAMKLPCKRSATADFAC
ncbi:hypothetical protein JQ633_00210 [Bradyrhizobium tropiciagri]|uniref:hypothetical protein n=1 Tax=Bradyrhizobium tropiciagri TaxID=312253 RepID=UPI001BA4BD72|nr:hypothetical protein [Bradyrhizobium tropiciagri]MBR0868761.1 hypothetical protein [Bradyrhizobium tropiciagri]